MNGNNDLNIKADGNGYNNPYLGTEKNEPTQGYHNNEYELQQMNILTCQNPKLVEPSYDANIYRKIPTISNTYDPFQHPPNLEIAKKFADAVSIAPIPGDFPGNMSIQEMINHNQNILCKASGLAPDKPKMSFCSKNGSLVYLGSGYPLYFEFQKICITIILVNQVFGIINAIRFNKQKACPLNTFLGSIGCSNTEYWDRFSIANFGTVYDSYGHFLAFLMMVVANCVIFSQGIYFIISIRKMKRNTDSPEDFTIRVQGIPKTEKEEDIIKTFNILVKELTGDENGVEKVSIAYYINDYVYQKEKKYDPKMVRQMKFEIQKKLLQEDDKDTAKITEKIENLKNELNHIKEDLNQQRDKILINLKNESHTGVVYVSFSKVEYAEKVRNKFKFTNWQQCGCCYPKDKYGINLYKDQYPIHCSQSYEPRDVIWKNIGVPKSLLRKKSILAKLAVLLALVLTFGIQLLLKWLQKKQSDNDPDHHKKMVQKAIAFGISITIVIMNNVLAIQIRRVIRYKCFISETERNDSEIYLIIRAQCINSCLLVTFTNWIIHGREKFAVAHESGILNDIHSILIAMVLNQVLRPIIQCLSPVKHCKRSKLKSNPAKTSQMQLEANKLMEGSGFDAIFSYARIYAIYFTSLYFFCLFPLSMMFCQLSISATYWVHKCLLLRAFVHPSYLNDRMIRRIYGDIRAGGVVLATGYQIFDYLLYDDIFGWSIAMFGVALLITFIPMNAFVPKKYNKKKIEGFYQENRKTFFSEFDRVNPLIAHRANKEYINWLTYKIENLGQDSFDDKRGMTILKDIIAKQDYQEEDPFRYVDMSHTTWNMDINEYQRNQIYSMGLYRVMKVKNYDLNARGLYDCCC